MLVSNHVGSVLKMLDARRRNLDAFSAVFCAVENLPETQDLRRIASPNTLHQRRRSVFDKKLRPHLTSQLHTGNGGASKLDGRFDFLQCGFINGFKLYTVQQSPTNRICSFRTYEAHLPR